MSNLSVVILAAGKGTRMYSSLPKVLHALAGKPMVQHVLDTTLSLKTEKIHVVYGFGGELIQKACTDYAINWVLQSEQLGTGHAVKQAIPYLDDNDTVLILYADTPLISSATLSTLIAKKPTNGLSLLTVELNDPTGYGRILRKNQNIIGIVEQKDASEAEKQIKEINTGIFAVNASDLKRWLNQLSDNNAQREFYLTDIIGFAANEGKEIVSVSTDNLDEIQGINNRLQLASLERAYQKQQAENLLLQGVMLMDPNRFDLRGKLVCGQDVTIDCNVIIEGHVTLGDRVSIGMGCILKDCHIDDDSIISPYSVIESSHLAQECTIGPFARLRPQSDLKARVHVGNFVEIKKATLGEGTKAGHLSYLGDSIIGKDVNIGAGTITCNYDGANKFQTLIGDNVFVGSDTQFVAPVCIANGVTIGAGTTVTQNVGENELVISRVRQKHIPNWPRPTKLKK